MSTIRPLARFGLVGFVALALGALIVGQVVANAQSSGPAAAPQDALVAAAAEHQSAVVEQGTDSDHADAIQAIREIAQDPNLSVTFKTTTWTPYLRDKSVEIYYSDVHQYVVDPSTNTVIQFGPRPRSAQEPPPPRKEGTPLSVNELETRTRSFIARNAPTVDLAELTPRHGSKQTPPRPASDTDKKGNPLPAPTGDQVKTVAFGFRWENLSAGIPGQRMTPFIQVVLTPNGEVGSYTNTISLAG